MLPEWSPFIEMKISSLLSLESINHRTKCPECHSSFKYYCYTCYFVNPVLLNQIPCVKLPISVAIVKHSKEANSKSTSIHAKLLAPSDVEIYECSKNFDNQDYNLSDEMFHDSDFTLNSCFVMFPDENAVEVSTIDPLKIKKLIVIDGTWNQAFSIYKSFFKNRYPSIRVTLGHGNMGTLFWRYQSLGTHALSTIEAIYWFFRSFDKEQNINYDNLLWFFSYFYHLIQKRYFANDLIKFNSKQRADYVKKSNYSESENLNFVELEESESIVPPL